jgi:hypothetical protein
MERTANDALGFIKSGLNYAFLRVQADTACGGASDNSCANNACSNIFV